MVFRYDLIWISFPSSDYLHLLFITLGLYEGLDWLQQTLAVRETKGSLAEWVGSFFTSSSASTSSSSSTSSTTPATPPPPPPVVPVEKTKISDPTKVQYPRAGCPQELFSSLFLIH